MHMGALFLTGSPASSSLLLKFNGRTKGARALRPGAVGVIRCAADMALGAGGFHYDKTLVFPRRHVWDPYRRLGVTRDASEEEIRGARNFLLEQYAGHESSVESIEAAYENILMASFRKRKKEKINLKSRLRKQVEESPSWVKRFIAYFEIPPVDTILRRLFLFAFMAGWSIMQAAEAGPAFQVALSLGSCIYFLNDKMKDVKRASVMGFLALVVGWFAGSVLVPTIPTFLLRPMWTLELLTSFFCFFSLFLACTFLK